MDRRGSGEALLAEADGDVAAVWEDEFSHLDLDVPDRVSGEQGVGDVFGECFDEASFLGGGDFLDLAGHDGVIDSVFHEVAKPGQSSDGGEDDGDFE